MREILYRAKLDPRFIVAPITSEWVEGSYIHQTRFYGDPVDKHWILTDGEFDYDYYEADQVLPETLGQFTGLYDYNGKRIFEGDILDRRCPRKHWSNRMYVSWCGDSFILQDFDENEDFLSNWCNAAYRNGEDVGGCYVIGNIHDNSELLKETMKGE